MKPLEVRVPHDLDNAEVRRRIDGGLQTARDQYEAQVGTIDAAWRDDGKLDVGLSVMGMPITSEVELAPRELVVRVTLPALAAMFGPQITKGITERVTLLLGPPRA